MVTFVYSYYFITGFKSSTLQENVRGYLNMHVASSISIPQVKKLVTVQYHYIIINCRNDTWLQTIHTIKRKHKLIQDKVTVT